MRVRTLIRFACVLYVCVLVIEPPAAHAYIGPGAGFAFVSSFFAVFAALALAFYKLATWPVRWVFRTLRWRKALRRSRVKKVVVVGLDGQDPQLTDKFMREGLLPNFKRLRDQGSYQRLLTSYPSESPVAWSSFQTGCNPGKHKVFDFLVPGNNSYMPELCSAKVTDNSKAIKLGKYRLPLGKPSIDLGRKSRSFWKVLGDHGIFSTVIRVPITFPPEKFHGALLSAMCVPDILGSQGTFSYYSSDPDEKAAFTGGIQIPVTVDDGVVRSHITGPENTIVEDGGEMRIPFEVHLGRNGTDSKLIIDKKSYPLKLNTYTPWIEVTFRPGLWFSVKGICRFYLKQATPHAKLYMSPVNIDPNKPALPISHPFTYAIYLSKTYGRFCTLGLAEDTWALNERVIDEEAFLKQTWAIHEERETQLFDAMEKTRRGSVVCVFDVTDRLQHMFFRYLDPDHPANRDKDREVHSGAMVDLYKRMDDLVGRVMDKAGDDTVVMVMSDHGFKPFRRCVNINTWLWENGYLSLRGERPTGSEWYADVDWSRTRAYAVGLGGIYLNTKGIRPQGIVEPGEAARDLRKEIREKLTGLRDDEKNQVAVAEVYDLKELYQGPYVGQAPDMLVGFKVGYRASWGCATGIVEPQVFGDNTKSWSGDHCMNPPDVPGIFFCNRKIPGETINIMDIGPTVMDLFGVPVPGFCDGKPRLTEK